MATYLSPPRMRPDTTRRFSGPERLEDRQMMDATASNILWEPAALSADNESAILANATARSLAMDVALPDASRLARGLLNGDVEIYDTSTGARMHTIPSNGSYVSQIEASPDGKTLAVGTGTPNVRLFDANSYAEIGGFAMPGFVYSIVFRGDEIFASTSDGGATTVYDMRTRAVRTILGGANQANYMTSINDRLYGYDARGILKEVDPASGQVLRSVNIAGGSRIDASSESGIIAMGTAGGNVIIFDEDLHQLGAFHPGMGAIQHVGFDASGTRLTARSDAAGIVFIDLSNVRAGGMMTEAGRAPAGDSAAYEVGMPMTPDGTVAFVHEANSVTALKTPWEPLPPPLPESGSEPGEIGIPSEVTDLIKEAVRLARNGTPWRAPEAGEIVSTSSAKATRVQLTPQTGEAVAFMANVFPTTSVTAHAYKGTEKIWSGAVPSDGVFSYENAEGITDVLFTSGSTTYVSNVSIVTDEAVDVPAYTLTPMNSAEFATFAARPIAQPTNMAAAGQRLDIRGAMSGTGSSESRVLLNRDQSNYTLLRMNVSSGNSRIFDVKAIRLKGLDYRQREEVEFVGLQDGFLERIDDRTWIVAPGMPATLVATLGFYQKSTYSIQVVNGLSRETIMPLLTMGKNTVDIDLLTMNDQFRTEGVFPGMTDVRQSEWPVFAKAGHRLNATYNIRNEALNGGAVGLDVYVGWYTGEPTRGTLQETFSFPLGGGETKMVSVNVTAPPKPADATSDRPIIHTVARLPNGESVIHARLGKAQKGETRVITNREGGGLNISYVSREYTAEEHDRIRRATDKALMALLNSPDERLTAVRDVLGDDHIVRLLAESSAAALAVANESTNENAVDLAMAKLEEEMEKSIMNAEDMVNGITPQDFINAYLTPEGKARFLHLLETEDELSHYGYDVASTPGFTGNFNEMYQGMFGRSAIQLEPVHFKIGIDLNKLPIFKPSPTPLLDIVNAVNVTIGQEDPRLALLREAEAEINRMVLEETAEAIQDIGITAKRSLIAMRRAAVWTAVTAYNTVDATGELGEDAVRITATEIAALAKIITLRMKNLTPFLRAEQATSYADKHKILMDAGVMEYHPGTGAHPGKLIVLINGHLQETNDDENEVGMEYLQGEFKDYEVIQFRVGLFLEPHYRNPGLIYEITEEFLFERLRKQGIFSEAPAVKAIGKAGYSWGGGTAAKLTDKLAVSEFKDIPVTLALIDAVQIGYEGFAQPVISRPAADIVYNYYQTNSDFTIEELLMDYFQVRTGNSSLTPSLVAKLYNVKEEGQPAHGQALVGAHNEKIDDATHMSIDDKKEQFGLSTLNSIRDLFLSKL